MPGFEDGGSSIPDPNEFDPTDAPDDTPLDFRSAFSETLSQHGFPDTLVLARERADDLFHERRLALLDYLKDHDPQSVRALADETGYDKGVVSRGLQRLARLDIIGFDDVGRTKAPRLKHPHVVVEPVV